MKKIILGLALLLTTSSCYAQQFLEVEPASDTIVIARMIVGDMYDSNTTLYTNNYRKAYSIDRQKDFVAGKEYIFALSTTKGVGDNRIRQATVIYYSLTPEQIEKDIELALKDIRR